MDLGWGGGDDSDLFISQHTWLALIDLVRWNETDQDKCLTYCEVGDKPAVFCLQALFNTVAEGHTQSNCLNARRFFIFLPSHKRRRLYFTITWTVFLNGKKAPNDSVGERSQKWETWKNPPLLLPSPLGHTVTSCWKQPFMMSQRALTTIPAS